MGGMGVDLRSGVYKGRKRVGAEEEVEDGCVVHLGNKWVGCREGG